MKKVMGVKIVHRIESEICGDIADLVVVEKDMVDKDMRVMDEYMVVRSPSLVALVKAYEFGKKVYNDFKDKDRAALAE